MVTCFLKHKMAVFLTLFYPEERQIDRLNHCLKLISCAEMVTCFLSANLRAFLEHFQGHPSKSP